jgi:hypothetical protein
VGAVGRGRRLHASLQRGAPQGRHAAEVVGGYWLIQARSKEEAVEWARRCPGENCRIEVRRVFELEDFPEDVQAALA